MLPLEILKGPIHLTEGENCLRIIKVWVNNLRIVFLLPPYVPHHWLTVFGRTHSIQTMKGKTNKLKVMKFTLLVDL